jgi:hypothetical protein
MQFSAAVVSRGMGEIRGIAGFCTPMISLGRPKTDLPPWQAPKIVEQRRTFGACQKCISRAKSLCEKGSDPSD